MFWDLVLLLFVVMLVAISAYIFSTTPVKLVFPVLEFRQWGAKYYYRGCSHCKKNSCCDRSVLIGRPFSVFDSHGSWFSYCSGFVRPELKG
jgi:hypothetical protein